METKDVPSTDIDISRAQSIYGWMTDDELRWLATQAREHLEIVELGSYLGRSTRALGDNTLGKVLALDDWLGADTDHRPVSPEKSDQMYKEFCESLDDLIKAKVVTPWRCDHNNNPVKVRPDMVFIDGDHSYNGVLRDIETWYPRIKTGGLISGHDVGHPPIRQALSELLPNYLIVNGTSIWYQIKSEGGK